MATKLQQLYERHILKQIAQFLATLVGQPTRIVTDEAVYKQQVIDRAWEQLSAPMRLAGRKRLRWDEFFLALRKEVFLGKEAKVNLRPDLMARMTALTRTMFGSAATAAGTKARTLPARAIPAETDIQTALPANSGKRSVAITTAPVVPIAEQVAPEQVSALGSINVEPWPPNAIGIDLGTTYSVVAHLDAHGRPCSIPNGAGDILTPSVVLFDEGAPIVGKEAVMASAMEPEKVADCAKRDMGSKNYRKRINGDYLPPEVISSIILRVLKEDAERKLGPVTKAVITVPAYFDEARRRATMDAGRLAGLDVLDIINEPTAAAIAYGYQIGFLDLHGRLPQEKPLRVLVFDLGGGTFDVTIVEIQGKSFKALATDGDVSLGGKDWDEKIIAIAAEQFKAQHREDPRDNPSSHQDLWVAAEVAKKTLSERPKATLYVNHLGSRMKVEITRQEFEEATAPLLSRTRTTAEIVVRQSGLTWDAIDKVLLVGGSSRMPMVLAMLRELSGKEPERSVSMDEAVAHGAALYADLVVQRKNPSGPGTPRFAITDINSHSLGIVGVDAASGRRKNQVLIPKNTPLPQTVTRVFKTHKANQSSVVIRIVEGESERPEACTEVGVCTIRPLPPNLPAGWPVQISYTYESNGRLQVSGKVKGHSVGVTTQFERANSLTDNDLALWVYSLDAV